MRHKIKPGRALMSRVSPRAIAIYLASKGELHRLYPKRDATADRRVL